MRKSVESRKQTDLRESAEAHHRTTIQRCIIAVFIVVLIILDGMFIVYLQTSTDNKLAAQRAAYAKQIVAQQNALIRRMNAARSLEATAKNQPLSSTEAGRQADVSDTSDTARCGVTGPAALTIVINKKHCIEPTTWVPPDIADVAGYPMRTIAATHMADMMQAAATAGVPFELTSGYRSYTDQQATYEEWISTAGLATANEVSAQPGFSEHQTGLAADIKVGNCVLECISSTSTYTWLQAHAAEYGFIQRYPAGLTSITGYSAEPWHWRYVGAGLASILKTEHIQTLEAYFGVSGGNYYNQ